MFIAVVQLVKRARFCSSNAISPSRTPLSSAVMFALCICGMPNALEAAPRTDQAAMVGRSISFNRDIRPILSENCFYCHGQDENKREAGLRLDQRDAAVDAGIFDFEDVELSPLLDRIHSEDPDVLMPPPNSNRQLSPAQKAKLEQWIREGASYETHWAFVNPERPTERSTNNAAWPRNPIDKFVLAKLEEYGLSPSPEADRATLIKRLYADLIGIPPTPEEVQRFVTDDHPDAYNKLVDGLLENRHYGERMALPWLDAARYADSNGFQQDGDTWQWIWRDWVVNALNEDMPFDQFTIWQLAGDLLPDATEQQKIASAFNRNHLLNGEGGAIAEEQRFNVLFDRIDTTATTWLGLTMACAQCHDHKYDPITMKDYYQLLDAFNRVPETGTPQYFSKRIRLGKPVIELPTEENERQIASFQSQIAKLRKQAEPKVELAYLAWKLGISADGGRGDVKDLPEDLKKKLETPKDQFDEKGQHAVEQELKKFFDEKIVNQLKSKIPELEKIDSLQTRLNNYRADQIPRVMVMSDEKPRETHILDRGQYLQPLEKVAFDVPGFLPPLDDEAPRNRLGFARWLVSDENPLTARVQVNRMWQHFFGAGLIKTAEDFGVQSEYPIHKDLLDWLAVEFRDGGWSMKTMHRLIVTSATYRQSSRMTEEHRTVDLENRLYARASRFRMPAMILRDWALASSGLLDPALGGRPVYPYQPDAVWESLAITKERDFTYPTSTGSNLYRRSIYTFWRRTVNPANMFDAANRQTCQVRTSVTSTPLHALTTLNDPTWVEAARVLAEDVIRRTELLDEQLVMAFQRILCRLPNDYELKVLADAYNKQLGEFSGNQKQALDLLQTGETARDESMDPAVHAAMTMVCLGLFNLDEALARQ